MIARYLLAALIVSAALGPAALAQGILERCAEDVAARCAEVEPGDGRVLACLYAHTATLSAGCYAATDEIGRLLEGFFDRLTVLYQACQTEFQGVCGDIATGDGKKLQCLQDHGSDLSAGCAAAFAKAELPPPVE